MNTNYIRIIAVLAYVILAPILGAFFDGLLVCSVVLDLQSHSHFMI